MAENLTIFSPFTAEQQYKGNELSFLKIHRDFVFIKLAPVWPKLGTISGLWSIIQVSYNTLKI